MFCRAKGDRGCVIRVVQLVNREGEGEKERDWV